MILIIKLQVSTYVTADLDNVLNENKTVCCPENIDSRKQIRSMSYIEVNNSVKNGSVSQHLRISKDNSTKGQTENESRDNFQISDIHHHREKELPLTIIIVGPAAAVGICLFLCIAFYFHNMQLNNQAKRLSITLNVPPQPHYISNAFLDINSTGTQQPMQPSPSPSVRIPRDDMFAYNQKRKSTVSTLNVPSTLQHKRGSSWSAYADQETLTLAAPRRHSTFII